MRCRTCRKPIISTQDAGVSVLSRQSAFQHADGTGAGVTEVTRAQWCETENGYVKVSPWRLCDSCKGGDHRNCVAKISKDVCCCDD